MKKLFVILVLLAIVLVGFMMNRKEEVPVTTTAPTHVLTSVTYYDQTTGAEVPATYTADAVTFTEASLGTMTLPQTISASGVRFANADESIVFWNKGDSIFITQNGKIVFNGTIGMPTALPSGKLPAGSTPPGDPAKLVGTWVWQKTTLQGATTILPKKLGVFAVTLTTDGHINGKTDCNGFGGDYTVGSDGVISVGSLISTQMYCEGSQESLFTSHLVKANNYSFDAAGNLLINFGNGAGSIVFSKK